MSSGGSGAPSDSRQSAEKPLRLTTMFKRRVPFTFVILFLCLALTETSTFAQDLPRYQKGLSQYQNGDFESAAGSFEEALKADPLNPYVLYNWGLSQYELGNNALALGAWRKSLNLNPTSSSTRQALEHLIKVRPLPGRRGPQGHWEVLRTSLLIYLPETLLVLLTTLFFTATGWALLRFLSERKTALEEELPLPSFPPLAILFFLLFATFQGLGFAKVYESQRTRGVIIAETVPMKSAPEDNASELFQIAQGAEVLVIRRKDDWLQIRYPSGLAGWVPDTSVFQTTRREI